MGLGHPEPPFIVPESCETLAVGDVVTLEPGVYLPGVAGMRYERNYLITENGYELLSDHSLRIESAWTEGNVTLPVNSACATSGVEIPGKC